VSHIEDFNTHGFIILKNILSKRQIEEYLSEVNLLYAEEQDKIISCKRQQDIDYLMYGNYGDHIFNVARKTRKFDNLFSNETLIKLLISLFDDKFILTQTEVRRNKFAQQEVGVNKFHRDGRFTVNKNLWIVAFWPLENITLENGPTEVICGSHYLEEKNDGIKKLLLANAGDLIVMNANLLHRATQMSKDISRWVVINTYNHWALKPAIDHTEYFRFSEIQNLENPLVDLFGFTSQPPSDERKRVYTCITPDELKKNLPL